MASIIYTPKDIFDQDFKVGVRGYSKVEVDEFLMSLKITRHMLLW